MKKIFLLVVGLIGCLISTSFISCREGKEVDIVVQADSLNRLAYEIRYKNLALSQEVAEKALLVGENFSSVKAEALNNLAFCAFIQMDFERADSLLKEVYRETANELECLVADVGMMKICQRTAMNKEFYDYRNSALRRIRRIEEDRVALLDNNIQHRFNYACSEFSITSSIYYYYLQQETQSLEAINEIDVEKELEEDTAQRLYYYYMKGSGGMYEADTRDEITLGEFDYLMNCLLLSREQGYVYFEANALQAMAELLKNKKNYTLLNEKRSRMMRVVNLHDLSWEELIVSLADNALTLFMEYGDWYQISGTYRTLASCYNELGKHEQALEELTKALSYVNLHHERFYHCSDTLDRLKPYIPMATNSTELEWINAEGIMTVPEWIARFREQLSVTYAALGMKPQSDYNRNIYLDILDYTRQDKELESRYMLLESESNILSVMLGLVIGGLIGVILLIWLLGKRWRIRYATQVDKLGITFDICKLITASIPSNAEKEEDVIEAVITSFKNKVLQLVGALDMEICLMDKKEPIHENGMISFDLTNSEGKLLGMWLLKTENGLKKDDRALLEIIVPYLSWTLENGLAIISLGDKRRYLEKEQYVYEQRLIENKRQNLIKKACLFLVTSITPYIDRVVNEVHKLVSLNYLADKEIKESKYKYIEELINRINEYNDILSIWIKMRQGSLNLNIETFELDSLFEVLQKGRRNFELKAQTFSVKRTDALVKADKALTLFMINTLTENARKYTQSGGEIQVYACEKDDYVEISVQDNGPGLSSEDVSRILDEKIYDSGKIGLQTALDVDELKRHKGSGFGLMNCKGIIEKYRKTNDIFKVCCFRIDSEPGKGSRFYFRLPKGIRRMWNIGVFLLVSAFYGCGEAIVNSEGMEEDSTIVSPVLNDSLLYGANQFANQVYHANLEGQYLDALLYADSALMCLNNHYLKYALQVAPMLQLVGEGASAELTWFSNRFDTDYYALLDIRNEAAVAYLALGELDAYQYNNQAYTSLYKQISVDSSLEEYCVRMQQSSTDKMVAIILCIALLLAVLIGYYLFYLRHRLAYRYGLEQVLEINRRILGVPTTPQKGAMEFTAALVAEIYAEVNELVSIDLLGIGVYSEEVRGLFHVFSSVDVEEEKMRQRMNQCYETKTTIWEKEEKDKYLPLCLEVGKERVCVGVLAFRCSSQAGREDDRLMLELVAGYVAIIVYNAIEIVAQKYRDIETVQDDARRVQREENQLHVQNLVLDNCLSTIKHETIYYPNRIKQIIDRLFIGSSKDEERRQVDTIAELIGYYKDVFTILSSCAARQLEEVTFRRSVVHSDDLKESVERYFKRMRKKSKLALDLVVEAESVQMIGDVIQLKFMLENLVNEALTYNESGLLELHIYKQGMFVRFDFIDRRRCPSLEELNELFYPNLVRMKRGNEDVLTGLEYLVCKQIIRDHDEFAGRRGCRMNACQATEGGFMVWFTIPIK